MRVSTAVVVTCLLLPVLAACSEDQDGPRVDSSSSVEAGDALDVGDAEYELCVPTPQGQDVLLGDVLLTNQADAAVELVAVELVGARNLELVDAYAVEPLPNDEGGTDLVGLRWARQTGDLPDGWRMPAVGRELASGESVNLVLHLGNTEGGGRLRSARIEYEVDGKRFQQQTRTSLAATPGRCDGGQPVPAEASAS